MWVRNNKGNVFVGNLPPDFSDERLAETFDPFGIVLSAAVARDPATGARLRYGFVDIATDKAMAKAIAALDGSEIDGCKLNVKPREKPDKKPGVGGRAAARGGPMRSGGRPNGKVREFGEAPWRRPANPGGEAQARPAQGAGADGRRPSQSERSMAAREGLPEVEPPARRDFEVVRRPIRRTAPSFQVERRPLPRRV